MPSLLLRIMLFVSSYFPLSLIMFLLLLAAHQPLWGITALLVGTAGVGALLFYMFSLAPRLAPIRVKITGYRSRDDQVMAYIVGYLLPFLTLPGGSWEQAVALMLFLGLLGWLYIHSALLFINPVLSVLGFHLYDISVEGSEESLSLLARHRVGRGEELSVIALGDGIVLEKRGGTR